MTERELLEEFCSVQIGTQSVTLYVRTIAWPSPHTPTSTWEAAVSLPASADAQAIDAAQRALLADARYFALCRVCETRQPLGWMHDQEHCQSCAEHEFGVTH